MEIIHITENSKIRILKPRKIAENNNTPQVKSITKCLFGVPDAEEVENLLQEQMKEDWDRIRNRFGINIEDIENAENIRVHANTPSKKRKLETSRKIVNGRRRRLFEPYNGRKITDFFQERKNVDPEKKEI